MKQWLIILAGLVFPGFALAAGGGHVFPDDDVVIDWDDKAAMQRGARTFINYCMGCHSLELSRYNRVGADLGISDDMMRDNLIFTTDVYGERTKVGELMLPQIASCVHVAGGNRIDALDKQATADNLFGWAMSMARQDVNVTVPAEPQHA